MQVYGAILSGAGSVDRLLPRAATAARAEPSLSRQAGQRLQMPASYEDHGGHAGRAAGGPNRVSFNRASNHLDTPLGGQLVHTACYA